MVQKRTWAGLTPYEHGLGEVRKARQRRLWPESSSPQYRLKVADDHIASETGILCEREGFTHPATAVTYIRTHFPREYEAGLYEVEPMTMQS